MYDIRLNVFCGVIHLLQTDPVIEHDLEMEHTISFHVFCISTLLNSECQLMIEEPSNETNRGGTVLLLKT
jgi:hypothetical protein